jgi:hypothetical protein
MTTLLRQRIERSIESKGFQLWRLRGTAQIRKSGVLAGAIQRSVIPSTFGRFRYFCTPSAREFY